MTEMQKKICEHYNAKGRAGCIKCPLRIGETERCIATMEMIPIYDQEEIIENCTVQILTDSRTGECSVGWRRN